jgi:hypothetical protein
MKKVIKLTERDLMNIVKRVIKEQSLSLEARLIEKGFENFKNNIFVKKIPKTGDFYFNLKRNGAEITILNPSEKVILKFNAKFNTNESNKIKLGFKSEPDAERLLELIINSFGNSGTTQPVSPKSTQLPTTSLPFPMEEDRLDFEKMSDDELHDFHPEIKRHPRHFKNFEPRGEFLKWRGEVAKRNIYKRGGKFHDSFDKKTKD